MVVSERENGLDQLEVLDFGTGARHRSRFDEPAYAVFAQANPEYDAGTWRFAYQSPVTPSTVSSTTRSRARGTCSSKRRCRATTRRNYASTACSRRHRDGTKIPLASCTRQARHAARRHGAGAAVRLRLVRHRRSPTVLRDAAGLLDRGVIYAIGAHSRRRRTGRSLARRGPHDEQVQHVHRLHRRGRISRQRRSTRRRTGSSIQGGSAGGLLMGAVVNMRPDLFGRGDRASAVRRRAQHDARRVPAAHDVEYSEWGNPNETAGIRLHAQYSPYDNVAPRAYPAMLDRDVAQRLASAVLGRNEVRREVARADDERTSPCCSRPTSAPATAARRAATTRYTRSRSRTRSSSAGSGRLAELN